MKETIQFIKKLWGNKRTRALSILIIYAIFFTFVFALIQSGTHEIKKPSESYEEDNLQNDFILENVNDYLLEFVGKETFTYDSVTKLITYQNIEYHLEEQPSVLDSYNFIFLTPKNISDLLINGTLATKNYLNKTETYLVKISTFEKIINNVDVLNNDNIEITVYEDNSKIIVDLSDYYGYLINMELRD